MKKHIILLFFLCLAACQSGSRWTQPEAWLTLNQPIQSNQVDVFYIASTNVLTESNSYYAVLSSEERSLLEKEMLFVRQVMGDSVNFFSPFYHQLTLEGFLCPDSVESRLAPVYQELDEAFDYYMAHINQGRSFVLMGFSQGAIIANHLTQRLTPEQASRLVATYMLGYRLNAEDLLNPNIRPAQDATERGVTVSFNTVADTAAVWHFISDGAATAINPVTWTTDTTSAMLIFKGDTTDIWVDPQKHILVAPSITAENYYNPIFEPFYPVGNLHLGDLLFYLPSVSTNIHQRAKKD